MPLQVLLVNGWSDDNKGDCAIVQGLLQLIASEAPNAEVGLVSSFSLSEAERAQHYRFTCAGSVPVVVYPPLLVASRLQTQPRQPLRSRLGSLVSATLLLLMAPWMSTKLAARWMDGNKRELFERFRTADVVVSKGGHIFVSDGSVGGLLGLYLYLFPLLLAIRLRRRVVLYGQSIGPVPDRFGRALLRAVLRRCEVVLAREDISLAFVRDVLGAPQAGVQTCWDTAFAVKGVALPSAIEEQLPPEFVVMTVRQWQFPGLSTEEGRQRYLAYLRAMASAIDYLWTEHHMPVVLAPQVIGPSMLENDYLAWDDLFPFVTEPASVVRLYADLSPGQLMSLYGRARLLLGTRFHSVILGLAVGTPSVAISYYGFKTRGIMRMLGLESLVLEIGSIDKTGIESAVKALFEDEDHHRAVLAEKIPTILEDSSRTARTVLLAAQAS